MKKITSIIIGLFILYTQAVAQNSRFIEIVAVDTIELSAIEFTYTITMSNNGVSTVYPVDVDVDDVDTAVLFPSQPSTTITDVRRILDKNNYRYELMALGNYSIGGYSRFGEKADSGISIRLKTEAELKKLYGILKDVEGITGKISDIKYPSISSQKSEIYKRLYEQAYTDASILAGISGGTITKLVSAQEVANTDFFSSYMDFFKKMDKSEIFAGMFASDGNFTQKVERKFSFKFELK